MKETSRKALALMALLGGFATLLGPKAVEAQQGRDFLFGRPKVTLSLNMGYGLPRAGSDLFQEIDTIFTLAKSDFRAPVIGASLAVFLDERVDLAIDLSYSGSRTWSEYRDWVEDVGNGVEIPIEQKTQFYRIPLTASVRYYFADRGREVSRFAWIPAKFAPYAGIGGGRVFYKFEQSGDFVDFVDYGIGWDEITSTGGAWLANLLAGAQYSASTYLVLTLEGRYSWANAELDRSAFVGYDPIDLSGFQATMGVGVRF